MEDATGLLFFHRGGTGRRVRVGFTGTATVIARTPGLISIGTGGLFCRVRSDFFNEKWIHSEMGKICDTSDPLGIYIKNLRKNTLHFMHTYSNVGLDSNS